MVLRLFLIKPGEQSVEPLDGAAEPPVGAHGLTSKPENEISESVFLEWQTHIHEVDVPALLLVGMVDGCPYAQCHGAFSVDMFLGCHIPQITVIARIDADASRNHLVLVQGVVQMAVAIVDELLEHTLVGNESADSLCGVAYQHAVKTVQTTGFLGFVGRHSQSMGLGQAFAHFVRKPFSGMSGVQRIVDFHPMYRKETVVSECLVAEHLAAHFAEFHEKAQAFAEFFYNALQHVGKQFFLVVAISVNAFAVDPRLGEQVRRNQRTSAAQNHKKMRHRHIPVVGDDHIRPF